MWLALAAVAFGQDPSDAASVPTTCIKTSIGRVLDFDAPAVLVLGERKGTLPDLSRARKIVKKLAARGPVTVAIQAVRTDHQTVLDQLSAGTIPIEQVPGLLDWENSWGFPFEAYQPLLETAVSTKSKLVGIGQDFTLRPSDQIVQSPPGFFQILADPMGDNPVPAELESKYVEFVSWAAHGLANTALSAWDGKGVLVIVVDRYFVEGGGGVPFQVQQLSQAKVSSAILVDAESRCYPGDFVIR